MYNNIRGYMCLNSGYDKDIMFVKTREEELMSERVGKFWFSFNTGEVFSKFFFESL